MFWILITFLLSIVMVYFQNNTFEPKTNKQPSPQGLRRWSGICKAFLKRASAQCVFHPCLALVPHKCTRLFTLSEQHPPWGCCWEKANYYLSLAQDVGRWQKDQWESVQKAAFGKLSFYSSESRKVAVFPNYAQNHLGKRLRSGPLITEGIRQRGFEIIQVSKIPTKSPFKHYPGPEHEK